MTCSKNYLYGFTNRMYRLFKEQPCLFTLKKLRGVHGWCIKDEKTFDSVLLDYRCDLIAALIHECLHYLYDEWSETKVLEMERNILNQMSLRQVKNTIKRFAAIL